MTEPLVASDRPTKKSNTEVELITVSKHGYKAVIYHDCYYPPFTVPALVDDLRARSVLRSNDIVIATFPKCGTTWTQQIVLSLLAGGDCAKVREPMELSVWAERSVSMSENPQSTSLDPAAPKSGMTVDEWNAWFPHESTLVPNTEKRRVIKTHAPHHLAPWKGGVDNGITKGTKIIVVTRNPNDTAVSMYHHSLDVPFFEYNGDFNDFLQSVFLTGKCESGCYWEWHAGWRATYLKNKKHILWISFEELKQDTSVVVRRIADFCDIEASDVVVEAVATGTDFAKMKELYTQVNAEKEAQGIGFKKNHLRQGKSGAWRKTFTPEQETIIAQHHETKCKDLDLDKNLFQI